MGIYANEPEGGTSGYIGVPTRNAPWHGQSGFEAMGHVVPMFRRAEGERHLKDMGFTRPGDAEVRFDIVNMMSNEIERDNSHGAMEAAYKKGLDVTGTYRLLSVLLCATEPKEPT